MEPRSVTPRQGNDRPCAAGRQAAARAAAVRRISPSTSAVRRIGAGPAAGAAGTVRRLAIIARTSCSEYPSGSRSRFTAWAYDLSSARWSSAAPVSPDETAVSPGGTAVSPDETAVSPGGTAVSPDGTAVSSDGTAAGMAGTGSRALASDAATALRVALSECSSSRYPPSPAPVSRSATTSSAAAFSDTNSTVLPACSRAAVMFAIVWLLPVPGGPSMVNDRPAIAAVTQARCADSAPRITGWAAGAARVLASYGAMSSGAGAAPVIPQVA